MENKEIKKQEKTAKRHYTRVMAFAISGLCSSIFLGVSILFLSGLAEASIQIVALNPFVAVGTDGVATLHKMDSTAALPLLALVLLFLVGPGLLLALNDGKRKERV